MFSGFYFQYPNAQTNVSAQLYPTGHDEIKVSTYQAVKKNLLMHTITWSNLKGTLMNFKGQPQNALVMCGFIYL